MNRPSKLLSTIALATLAFGVAGCTTSPTIDKTAEPTFDGLFPIKGGSFDEAWARPDVDISKYTKIRLQGVGIEYRPGGESGRTFTSRTRADHFEVTPQQRAAFEQLMRDVFRDELGKSSHFTLVDEDGPDVLLVKGGLLDVVSFVPPQQMGRGGVFLTRIGEATLVLEIRDSITQTALARVVDRRAAENMVMEESNRVTNTREVRRLARFWASRLRDRLDELANPES